MNWFAAARGLSEAAVSFCLTLKNLFGLALRQATGRAKSVLELSGLAWPVPDFSKLCRCQLGLNVQVPYTPSQGSPHLLVDSTGTKCLGEGEWKCKKHGTDASVIGASCILALMRRPCRLGQSAWPPTTSVIGAVVPDSLGQLPANEVLKSSTADGAHDTNHVHEAVISRGAMPIIAASKNARMRKGAVFVHRNAAIAACKRLGVRYLEAITSEAWWRPR